MEWLTFDYAMYGWYCQIFTMARCPLWSLSTVPFILQFIQEHFQFASSTGLFRRACPSKKERTCLVWHSKLRAELISPTLMSHDQCLYKHTLSLAFVPLEHLNIFDVVKGNDMFHIVGYPSNLHIIYWWIK